MHILCWLSPERWCISSSVIPYIEIPSLPLFGPLAIQPFGVLVASAILIGSWFVQRRAFQEGVDVEEIRTAIAWAVIPGFIGAHWVAILFYHPERIADEGPIVFLKFWSGISSYGGFLGAFAGLTYYFKRQNKKWLKEAELITQGLVIAWIFGRLACAVAYDHPGSPTDWFIGQVYRDGVVRHNLGLYETLYALFIATPLVLILYRFRPRQGLITGCVCLSYAPLRYWFDTMRATDLSHSDARYLGLTPAQYLSLGLTILGIYLIIKSFSQPRIVRLPDEEIAAAKAAAKALHKKPEENKKPRPHKGAGKKARKKKRR